MRHSTRYDLAAIIAAVIVIVAIFGVAVHPIGLIVSVIFLVLYLVGGLIS
jgi:hypothetical protein